MAPIEIYEDGSKLMHQARNANKIETLSKGSSYEQFQSRRHELSWTTHTRLEVPGKAAILAQGSKESFCQSHVSQLKKSIQLIKKKPRIRLIIHRIDMDYLKIISHAVSLFANLPDRKKKLGFVVLLTDKTGRVNWLHFRIYKWKSVVRPVLVGETHASVDAFDGAYAIRHVLEDMIMKTVTLSLVTGSDSLLKVIILSSTTTKRLLMFDLKAGREPYQESRIDNMGWI